MSRLDKQPAFPKFVSRWKAVRRKSRGISLLFACLCLRSLATAQAQPIQPEMPHVEQRGNVAQLIVDGKPFLLFGGELHNAGSSSVEYMKAVWPRLSAVHMDVQSAPVPFANR